jgi:hypothetical protein
MLGKHSTMVLGGQLCVCHFEEDIRKNSYLSMLISRKELENLTNDDLLEVKIS